MLTIGSLFSGIGGLELGLERTGGFKTVWQVEIDDYATRVLERHWTHVRRWRDVTTFPPDYDGDDCDAPRTCQAQTRSADESVTGGECPGWQTDLICGGFPCQDISYAGRGAGLAGERSGLFYEVARIVGLLRPRYVLLENVAALLTRGLGEVLGTLASLGYDAEWHCVPAAAVGAPHIRDRIFIIGYLADAGSDGRRAGRDDDREHDRTVSAADGAVVTPDSKPVGRDARGGECGDEESEGCWRRQPRRSDQDLADSAGIRRERRLLERRVEGSERKQGTRLKEFACGQRWWSTEPNVGRVAHGVPSRVDRLRCLGNAVVPQVAEFIGHMILDMESQ